MRDVIAKRLTTLLLVASLLVPFTSGLAMAMGVADGRLLVICSGDGLRTIYIDENGDATQVSEEAINCVLKSAADTAQAVMPRREGQRLLFFATPTPAQSFSVAGLSFLTPHPRAPPMI